MKKMFDMGIPPLYKADLCSAKRLEKQSETACRALKKNSEN